MRKIMNSEINKIVEMDDKIFKIEVNSKIIDVILKDQANAYSNIDRTYTKANLEEICTQAEVRNDIAITAIEELKESLEAL